MDRMKKCFVELEIVSKSTISITLRVVYKSCPSSTGPPYGPQPKKKREKKVFVLSSDSIVVPAAAPAAADASNLKSPVPFLFCTPLPSHSAKMEKWEDTRRRARTLETDIDNKLIAFNRLSISQVLSVLVGYLCSTTSPFLVALPCFLFQNGMLQCSRASAGSRQVGG